MKDLWGSLVVAAVLLVASMIGTTIGLMWADWLCDSDLLECWAVGPYR